MFLILLAHFTFPVEIDTLEYSRVKATSVFMHLRIFSCSHLKYPTHTISLCKLGNFDFQLCYRTVIVHLEWNLIFFVGVVVESTVIAYNMDSRKFHVIPTHYVQYGRHDILLEMKGRPINLLCVSLFSELESLAK
jgi:hypothetical protein